MTIVNHESYHGEINRKKSKKRLTRSGRHCYLTRYRKSKKHYVLSIYKQTEDKPGHFEIVIDADGCMRLEKEPDLHFYKIEELLHHYESHPIDTNYASIGQTYSVKDWERDHRCTIL